ncbi:MAG: aldo/keto reductase [Cyanobacteriota bacterium]|nr:aldo/keto reductase [Cyanobacteriota bacterium]
MSEPSPFIPLIVGCWQLDDRSWKPLSESDIGRTLDTYLALGVNSFDTADIYGRSEQLLGRLLKGRECTILTKAVFFSGIPTASHIRHKIENSLRHLGRDCLDRVQVHWQDAQLDFSSTFATLNALVEQGKIKTLGVTNFNTPMLEKALQHAPIVSHQVQYSLIDRRVEQSMQALCLHHRIGLLAYGSLAGGFLSGKFRGVRSPHPESAHARGFYYNAMIQAHGGWGGVLQLLEALAPLAEKYQKTIGQIALNWVKQQAGVQALVTGFTLDRQQIQSNLQSFTWTLDPQDQQALTELSTRLFKQVGDIYSYERGH